MTGATGHRKEGCGSWASSAGEAKLQVVVRRAGWIGYLTDFSIVALLEGATGRELRVVSMTSSSAERRK